MLNRLTRVIVFIVLLGGSQIFLPLSVLLWLFKGGDNVFIEALCWAVTGD